MSELNLSILSNLRPATPKKTPRKSLAGQKFTRWTVYSLMGYDKHDAGHWLCRCDCGVWRIVPAQKLRNGRAKSCGCYLNDIRGDANRTHGMSRSTTHSRWGDMHTRCYNPKFKQFADWGGRGIVICEGFHSFENFFNALGEPPAKHMLDRINNEGNYSCGTCEECLSKNWLMNVRWSPRKESARNSRKNVFLTANDQTHCVAEWAEILNLSPPLIAKRKRAGWPDAECLGFKERPSADRYRRKA